LTGVASFARLLLDETAADDPRRPIVEKIERQAFRASRLIGSLLDLARGRPRDLLPIDPAEIIREAIRALGDDAATRGVKILVSAQDPSPRVAGHLDALVQVLVNLLKNGVEAAAQARAGSPGRGQVALRLSREGESVLIQVDDDGEGLSETEAARVFEPFHTTKAAQGGVGLGLVIARDIIRAHGGLLTVDSAKGRGSRFTVALPVSR
jgi:signal transduction histidine kinase